MRRPSRTTKNSWGIRIFMLALCVCLVLPVGTGAFAGSAEQKAAHVDLQADVDAEKNATSYAFELLPAFDNPEQDPVTQPVVSHPAADGTVQLLDGTAYTEPGTYRYILQQQSVSLPEVTLDDSVYTIEVLVSSSDEGLHAEIEAADANGTPVDPATLCFTNTSVSGHTSLILGGKQTLRSDIQKANEFTYALTAEADAPLPEAAQAQNTAAGSFRFGRVVFDKPGEYVYRISQSSDLPAGTSAPESDHFTVLVNVSQDGNGALQAAATVQDATGKKCEEVVFENEADSPLLELELAQALNTGAFTTGALEGKAGDTIHYRVTVTNTSDRDAAGAAVRQSVPDGLVVDTQSLPEGCTVDENGVFWPIGDVPAGTSQHMEFDTFIPEIEEDVTWTASATLDYSNHIAVGRTTRAASEPEIVDSNPLKITGLASRTVLQAAPTNFIAASLGEVPLTISKEQCLNDGFYSGDLMHTAAGDIATYRITIMNSSSAAATGVIVTDTIPSGLTLVTNSISDGGIETDGVVTWNIGTLDAGLSRSVSFMVQCPAATQFTTWTNTAMFTYQGASRYISSNSVSLDQTPGATPTVTPSPTPTPTATVTPTPTPVPTATPTLTSPEPTPTPAGSAPHTNDGTLLAMWVIIAVAAGAIVWITARKLRKLHQK